MSTGRSSGILALLLSAALLLGACSGQPPAVRGSEPGVTPSRPSARTGGATSAGLDHVVIIVEENKPATSILGNSDAPYLNQLAATYSLATNYKAVTHPSLPNYLALTSGTTAGITTDCSPSGCEADVTPIAHEIEASGRTWKIYAESMPAPCTASNSGRYAVRHDPFVYYPSVTEDQGYCRQHVVPFSQLSTDLQTATSLSSYSFISPDICNDMHDCSVHTGDSWLAQQVPRILASPAFTTQNSLLVITFDEGDDQSNQVVTIFAGPAAKTGYRSRAAYNHYSLLHTIERAWGLAPLTDNDKFAAVMSDMLGWRRTGQSAGPSSSARTSR